MFEILPSGIRDLYPMLSFMLGLDGGDHLVVEIYDRPDECDDWLAATISVHAGAFSAEFDATLQTCDFPRFRAGLEMLYKTLVGDANFDTIERQLQITCTGNGRGGIDVEGIAQDRTGDGNQLRFRFEIDQTFLPAIISDLRGIESEFPDKIQPPFPQ